MFHFPDWNAIRIVNNTRSQKNQQQTETGEKIKVAKRKIQEKIKTKLNRNYVKGSCSCLLRACHLRKHDLTQNKNLEKVLGAVDRLELIAKPPQLDEVAPQIIPGEDANNFIKFLFSDEPLSLAFISSTLIKALLLKKNETLLKDVRTGMQAYLEKLADKLNQAEFNHSQEQQLGKILLGNILALYPFFEPNDGDIVKIPQKMDGKWCLIDYKVKMLQMTPEWKGDPYFAYGFSPESTVLHPEIHSHLVFMGTPPPTTKGAAHAEFTDFIPGYSVGETIYEEGKKTIEEWLKQEKEKTKQKPNIYGQSLGGSLCQILAAHHPTAIGEVFAYNPPSLWSSLLLKYQENIKKLEKEQLPTINIFCQENDPIYSLGAGWNPGWNVYQVIPKKSFNFYEAHIRAFSSQQVVVLKMNQTDILSHNASVARRIYNVIAEILRVPFFLIKGLALSKQIVAHQASKLIDSIHQHAVFSIFRPKKHTLIPL